MAILLRTWMLKGEHKRSAKTGAGPGNSIRRGEYHVSQRFIKNSRRECVADSNCNYRDCVIQQTRISSLTGQLLYRLRLDRAQCGTGSTE